LRAFLLKKEFTSRVLGLLILGSSSPLVLYAQNPVDPGMLFLESFAGSCSSRGIFTQKALSDTLALKRILETIKDDPACQSLTPIFSQIVSVEQQFSFLNEGINNDQMQELEDYADRLAFAVSTSQDLVEQALLSAELAETRIQILRQPSNDSANLRASRSQAVQQLVVYLTALNQNYADQSTCFERHKSLPIQLAGHLLSIAGGFFDPSLNLALGLAGRMISGFFTFFDNLKLNKRLSDYRQTTMQVGMACAMEALEQTLCDIQDRRSMINVIQDYREEDEIPEAWMGFDLLTRDYASFQKFLRRVEAGSPAGSDQQGIQRGEFRQREGNFNAQVEDLSGKIGQAKIEIAEFGGNQSGVIQRLSKLVEELTDVIFSKDGPLRDAIPRGDYHAAQLWIRVSSPFVTEKSEDGNLKGPFTIIQELDSGVASHLYQDADVVTNIDLEGFKANLDLILTKALELLRVERRVNLIADPKGALAYWTLREGEGLTPERVAREMMGYLNMLESAWMMHPEWFDDEALEQQQLDLLADTKSRLSKILEAMESNDVLDPWKDDGSFVSGDLIDDARLQIIYDQMVLKEKDQFITDRINQIVELDLEKRLRLGLLKNEDDLDAVVRLAHQQLIDAIGMGLAKRLEPMKEDLTQAESVAKANLRNFFKHYREPLVESVKSLFSLADDFQENPFGAARRQSNKLCVLALNDPPAAAKYEPS